MHGIVPVEDPGRKLHLAIRKNAPGEEGKPIPSIRQSAWSNIPNNKKHVAGISD